MSNVPLLGFMSSYSFTFLFLCCMYVFMYVLVFSFSNGKKMSCLTIKLPFKILLFFTVAIVQSLGDVRLFVTPWTAVPGFPVLRYFPEFSQIHVNWVSDAIQLSHPLSSPCPPSCPQSFPASGSFPTSWFFASGGQSVGASASASVLPMNIQDSFPLGWSGLISLQSKGLRRVFPNTTVQK